MRAYHRDRDRYFQMQYLTARDHIIPFLESEIELNDQTHVLEVGCGEAGVLLAFLEKGCQCLGIELNEIRTKKARQYHAEAVEAGQISFLNKNIYDIDESQDLDQLFDLIILKDVIEHIPGHEKIIGRLADFLNPGGLIFFGFPPWYMPFGGHQQICRNKFLSVWPYVHLLPKSMYKGLLKAAGEPENVVQELLEIKETGITIEQFERYSERNDMVVRKQNHFLINPIYQYKFKLKPRRQLGLIRSIPFLRNFFTTAVYYIVAKKG